MSTALPRDVVGSIAEPDEHRWFTRWDPAWKWIITVGWWAVGALMVSSFSVLYLVGGHPTEVSSPADLAINVVDVSFGLAAICLVRWRKTVPWVPWATAVIGGFTATGIFAVAWILCSTATKRRIRQMLALSATYLTTALILAEVSLVVRRGESLMVPGDLVLSMVAMLGLVTMMAGLWCTVITAIGFYVGARRDLIAALKERALTAEREAELRVEAGRAAERQAIAREMHDVLAHRISLVSMHAGVLAFREDLPPEKTREIAGIIQENAHASLTELRTVLSQLRDDGRPEAPQPTLADLPRLVSDHASLGTRVHLEDGLRERESVSPVVARQLYRIVQEALTNARKHAEGSEVWVTVLGRPSDGIRLEVRNALSRKSAVPGAQLGLVGLRERAELVGGTLEAGREREDFVVRAWLPWQK